MTVEGGENLASGNLFPALILSMTLPTQPTLLASRVFGNIGY